MKYKQAQDIAAGLRRTADFFEKDGAKLPNGILDNVEFRCSVYVSGKPELAQAVRTLINSQTGMVTKEHSSYSVTATAKFGDHVKVEYWASRDSVCTKRVVGTEQVPVKRLLKSQANSLIRISSSGIVSRCLHLASSTMCSYL
jgi:tRNA G18 (ribose-2'-O)-methylase SpoU